MQLGSPTLQPGPGEFGSPYPAFESKASCSQCGVRGLCMPQGLSDDDLTRLDELIGAPRRIERGRSLFRVGDRFSALYIVKSGFFKTDLVVEDGRNQVTGFQMAGEMLGLDGISGEVHTCNAVALEDSQICLLPFTRLVALAAHIDGLQQHLHKLMSREIVRDQGVMMLLNTRRAEERVASFLLNLSQRFAARGYSPYEFHLRMTREEIGSYLGLTWETVSRIFSCFQESGLIEVQHKHIRILNASGLRRIPLKKPVAQAA